MSLSSSWYCLEIVPLATMDHHRTLTTYPHISMVTTSVVASTRGSLCSRIVVDACCDYGVDFESMVASQVVTVAA